MHAFILYIVFLSARKGSFCTHTRLHVALFCPAAVEKSACGAFELTKPTATATAARSVCYTCFRLLYKVIGRVD